MFRYISLSVHFLTEDFDYKSELYGIYRFDESHTGKNMQALLSRVLEEKALRDATLFTICTDNGYNFVNVSLAVVFVIFPMFYFLFSLFIFEQASDGLVGEDNTLCCAHTLQLAVMVRL